METDLIDKSIELDNGSLQISLAGLQFSEYSSVSNDPNEYVSSKI
jgi:hypothetical protein